MKITHNNHLFSAFSAIDQLLYKHKALLNRKFGEHQTKVAPIDASQTEQLLTRFKGVLEAELEPSQSLHQTEGIGLRKQRQIAGFIANLSHLEHSSLTDWCCGKSHLGRNAATLLAKPLMGVEYNSKLAEQAQAIASNEHIEAQFHVADVLDKPALIRAQTTIMALHACGELHRSLIDQFSLSEASKLALAPCCYHKYWRKVYTPLSQEARQSQFQPTAAILKFATRELVTGSKREAYLRDKLRAYRLGFDSWVRYKLGRTTYTPLPSTPMSAAKLSFAKFCKWGAEQRVSSLTHAAPSSAFEEQGIRRLKEEQRHEAAIAPLRPLVEAWLILDLAIALEERGFSVSLQRFCNYHDSPRNTLIIAQRAEQA